MIRTWVRISVAAAFAWFLAVLAAPVAADGVAVEGRDRALLRLPANLPIESYANQGYRLKRRPDGLVEVEVRVAPVLGREAWEPSLTPADPSAATTPETPEEPVKRLTRSVVAGAGNRYETASRILAWVSRNLRYELDRDQDQGADAVLNRRSAYCTGAARLTVAMLQAAGLEAREVAGVLVEPLNGPAAPGFHRWVEVKLDEGWVFSDPLASHHFVAANYVRLAGTTVTSPDLSAASILKRSDGLTPVDVYPGSADSVLGRRDPRRQLSGVLRVVAPPGAGPTAVLVGEGHRRELALSRGEATFLGVEPGTYTVILGGVSSARVPRGYRVEITSRGRAELLLPGADPARSLAHPRPERSRRRSR